MNLRCCTKSKTACVSMVALAVLMGWALHWTAATARADSPVTKYSAVLGAEFYLGRFYFPGHGSSRAAVVDILNENSIMRAAGVQAGDIITRLDNVSISNLDQLDRHYCWTTIRYWRSPNGDPDSRNKTVHTGRFHIPSSRCRCR